MNKYVKKSTKKQIIKNESPKNIVAVGGHYLLWRFDSRSIAGMANLQPILCAIGKGKN
jgi:hypothetical protein